MTRSRLTGGGSDSPRAGRRLRCGAALAAVVALGLASRAWPVGWPPYDKGLGDVLYAAAAYLALAVLFPRWPGWLLASLAASACLAVEGLQLSGLNARLLEVPVLRWFLGTDFSWHDVCCYLLGAAAALGLDSLARVRRGRS
jgi:hypothetical protein